MNSCRPEMNTFRGVRFFSPGSGSRADDANVDVSYQTKICLFRKEHISIWAQSGFRDRSAATRNCCDDIQAAQKSFWPRFRSVPARRRARPSFSTMRCAMFRLVATIHSVSRLFRRTSRPLFVPTKIVMSHLSSTVGSLARIYSRSD